MTHAKYNARFLKSNNFSSNHYLTYKMGYSVYCTFTCIDRQNQDYSDYGSYKQNVGISVKIKELMLLTGNLFGERI